MSQLLHLWTLLVSRLSFSRASLFQDFLHSHNSWEWLRDDPAWMKRPLAKWPDKIRLVGRLATVCGSFSKFYQPKLIGLAWEILRRSILDSFHRSELRILRRQGLRSPREMRKLRLLKLSYPYYKVELKRYAREVDRREAHLADPWTESELDNMVASSSEDDLP